MSNDLSDILNNPAILSILATVGAFILSTFLAPRLGEVIKALTAFIFLNIKHWIAFSFLGTLLYYTFNLPLILTIFIAVFITFIISLILSTRNFSKRPTIIYFGSYFENNSTYLDKNIETEKIDSIVEQEIEDFNKNSYLVTKQVIKFKSMDIPKFYVLMKSYKSLNLLYRKLVTKNTVFGFSFFVNSNSIHYKSYLNTNKNDTSVIFQDNLDAIQEILESVNVNQRVKVSLSLKVNFVFISQSFNDMFIAFNDLTSLKHSLDDNWRIIDSVKKDIKANDIISIKATRFINIFEVSHYRYNAMLMFKREDYIKGFTNLFESMKLNPYFPYDNYNDFKRYFATRYYLEILPLMIDLEEKDHSTLYSDVISTYNILSSRLEDNVVLFTIDIVKEFIDIEFLSSTDIEFVELKLNELDENVANLIFKYEILKFLPKGTDQIYKLYVDRLEECIDVLEKIIEIDPFFPLIHQKIGMIKLMLSSSNMNENLREEATNSLKIGFDEIRNLGIDLVRNDESLSENIDEASNDWIDENSYKD